MTPGVRKLALTTHVVLSVGWIGAVAAYVALVATLLATHDVHTVQASYVAMKTLIWFVIVPFSLASLVTGLIQSFGTAWGLFRHWWVLASLVLNILGILVLLEYSKTLDQFADMAANSALSSADLDVLRSPVHLVHSGGGLVVLLLVAALSVFKPRGLTSYGRRKQRAQPGMRRVDGVRA